MMREAGKTQIGLTPALSPSYGSMVYSDRWGNRYHQNNQHLPQTKRVVIGLRDGDSHDLSIHAWFDTFTDELRCQNIHDDW